MATGLVPQAGFLLLSSWESLWENCSTGGWWGPSDRESEEHLQSSACQAGEECFKLKMPGGGEPQSIPLLPVWCQCQQ